MPIEMSEFKRALEPLEERILELLSKDPRRAYSLIEIITRCEGHADDLTAMTVVMIERQATGKSPLWDRYTSTIERLLADGRLQSASYKGVDYYARPAL